MSEPEKCPQCFGSGMTAGRRTCSKCGGSGISPSLPLSEAGTSVEVKLLEWKGRNPGSSGHVWAEAECIIGLYRLSQSKINGTWRWSLNALDGPWSLPFSDSKTARDAAQADYAQRVLSALIQPTPAETDAKPVAWLIERNDMGPGRPRTDFTQSQSHADGHSTAGATVTPLYPATAIESLSRQLEEAREALTVERKKRGQQHDYANMRDVQVVQLAGFAKWAIREGAFSGCDLYGGDVQDEAEKAGLIVRTVYDPAIHGPSDVAEPGMEWFVFSSLLAIEETVSHG